MKEIKGKKIVFIDLDGTLYDERSKGGTISKRNLEALNDLEQRGILPVISTGRLNDQAKKLIIETGVNYSVQGNGSKITGEDLKVLHTEHLNVGAGKKLFEIARDNDVLFIYNGNWRFQGKSSEVFDNWIAGSEFYVDEEYETYPDIVYTAGFYNLKDEKQQDELIKLIEKEVPEAIALKIKHPHLSIEISASNATKGAGNAWLAKKLGFDDPETWLHIGDSMNDYSAAEYMDLIAMDNSNPLLKEVAIAVGPHYENAGLAEILDKIV